jgi:Na+/phosphate symporter
MMKVIALLVCLIGVLIYALSDSAKLMEIGRLMFAFGLLAVLLGGLPKWSLDVKQ